MSGIRRNLMGPDPVGVPSPLTVHVHPYPTRYHGTFATRPVFGFPFMRQPHAVYKPDDFYSFYPGLSGLGAVYWMSYSATDKADVTKLQNEINALLAPKYLPIPVTGVLESKTCGAVELLGSSLSSALGVQARASCAAAKKAGAKFTAPTPNASYTPSTTLAVDVPDSPHANPDSFVPEVPSPGVAVVASSAPASAPAPTTSSVAPAPSVVAVPPASALAPAAARTPEVRAQAAAQQAMAPEPKVVRTTAPISKNVKIALGVAALTALAAAIYAAKSRTSGKSR